MNRPTPAATTALPPRPAGVEIRGPSPASAPAILTTEALEFVADLVRRFGWRREELLARRAALQARWDAGWRPGFLPETAALRDAEWTIAPVPADLQDRRVEITGPTDRKMIINALNSGANVFMADFEDANAPTWSNMVDGQANLADAVRGTILYTAPETGRVYELSAKRAVLMARPRGWHLVERHLLVDGRPAPASLVDFGLYAFHNAAELLARGTGPYVYLPKLESHLEARLWNEVFLRSEERLGLPRGSIKATVLIETLPAAFEMDEILYELREHSAGLNCGRWDYIFSFIKKHRADRAALLPDRSEITMDRGFLRAYVQRLIRTCHRRGAHAMGGMAAQIPIKDDAAANEGALAAVRADKTREAREGHDGTWVAHPGLVPLAREIFDAIVPTPNQLHVRRDDVSVTERELLAIPAGSRTEAGLRRSVRVSVQYLEAWLRGQGCVPIEGLMEDAATVEISRAQVWQWLAHEARFSDGSLLTLPRFRSILDEEMAALRTRLGEPRFRTGRFERARALFEEISTAPQFVEFLTIPAYEALLREEEAARPAEDGGRANGPPTIHGGGPNGDGVTIPTRTTNPSAQRTLFVHDDPDRWDGIVRPYAPAEVERLRGTVRIEHTLAERGSRRLWTLLGERPFVHALGALTGNQAVQMARAGLEAIYVSGWQVAADANTAGQTYPDQSLYPADSVPALVRRIQKALVRADQIEAAEGRPGTCWFPPIVADAEAGFGGVLNAFELMKAMIEAGAAGVHFEDQVASEKKCGHMGGKVLVPTSQFIRTLVAARLAADVMDVPTILIARTDANSAKLLLSDVDPADAPFVLPERSPEGFYRLAGGMDCAIARALAYAPYADLIWCETSTPDLDEAARFADAVHARFPGKRLAYNCSPSFNWKKHLDDAAIAGFQRRLGEMGYRFQFVTLAGFHALNHATFTLAADYRDRGMAAYTDLQQAEFAAEREGYTATRHQREVGTGYFDLITETITAGQASTTALAGSTEAEQFTDLDRIASARDAIGQEHERIHQVVDRLRAARERTAIAALLEELRAMLAGHFEREESAGGLHGLIRAHAPHSRPAFERLAAEHGELLAGIDGLRAPGANGKAAEIRRAVDALLTRLAEHERREDDLARGALEQEPRPGG